MKRGAFQNAEVSIDDETAKKRRLNFVESDANNSVIDSVNDSVSHRLNDGVNNSGSSDFPDHSISVKREREDYFDFDSKQIISKTSSSSLRLEAVTTNNSSMGEAVNLPRVKVMREIEDPTESRGCSRFVPALTPEECIEPPVGGEGEGISGFSFGKIDR